METKVVIRPIGWDAASMHIHSECAGDAWIPQLILRYLQVSGRDLLVGQYTPGLLQVWTKSAGDCNIPA
jgi:hypothetical protein